jgi:hypothetical protein
LGHVAEHVADANSEYGFVLSRNEHGVHTFAPALDMVFMGQSTQKVALYSKVRGFKSGLFVLCPAKHCLQSFVDLAPVMLLYVPSGQFFRIPFVQYIPGSQRLQDSAPAYVPAGQSIFIESLHMLPTGHVTHDFEVLLVEY